MQKTTLFLSLLLLVACGDDDTTCPPGEVRIGAVCVMSMSDAGTDAGSDAGAPDISASEVCNGVDDDMDGTVDEADPMLDEACGADIGVCTAGVTVCTEGELVCDGVQAGEEICNGLDDDCDGQIDEDAIQDYYLDEDGDGFGSGGVCLACAPEECGEGDWVTMDGDCDETCDTCFEGGTEVCDGLDNNCDGDADEGVQVPLFEDTDGDGYGVGSSSPGCTDVDGNPPMGFALEAGDCAAMDERANPGTTRGYSTPIVGGPLDGTFDFDCDGTEENIIRRCDQTMMEVAPVCGPIPSVCWIGFVSPDSNGCGVLDASVTRPVSGTTVVPGVSDGVCRFTGPPSEDLYDIECR